MKTKISLTLFVVLLALTIPVLAHEESDSMTGGFDIHLTPQQAFQNNPIPIEAAITQNDTVVAGLNVFFMVDKHEIGLSERVEATEREPGHYFAKYTFTNPGSYEIHASFIHNGEEIRKTFDVDVTGSSNIEQYVMTAVIGAVAIAALYALRSRKIKKAFIACIIILAMIYISYSLYVVYASGAAQRGVTVCVSTTECYWSAHIHAQVEVSTCGQDYRFPIEKGPLDGPHTHEEKNLIHFHDRLRFDPVTKEILNPAPLKLGAFFDNMEVPFDGNKVLDKMNGDLCNGQSGIVKMFVNGKPSGDFRDYIWKDGDKIDIIFDEKPAEQAAKEVQKATAKLTPELTLPIIVGFALIDSINPCVIGVLLLLITILLKSKNKNIVLVNGSVYTVGVYVTYFIGGITLLSIFNAVREVQIISQMFYVVIGIFVLFAAFLEIKDYFFYGRWFSLGIPKRFVSAVESNAKSSHSSLLAAVVFGAIVTLIELPCTGAPYLAIITLMSQSGIQFYNALLLLILYNFIFVLPLIVIIYLAYRGVGYKKMEFWRREHKGKMRLIVGLVLLAISVWITTTVLDWLLLHFIVGSAIVIIIMYIAKNLEARHIHRRRRENGRKSKKTGRERRKV